MRRGFVWIHLCALRRSGKTSVAQGACRREISAKRIDCSNRLTRRFGVVSIESSRHQIGEEWLKVGVDARRHVPRFQKNWARALDK